jgi:hypothetical protein
VLKWWKPFSLVALDLQSPINRSDCGVDMLDATDGKKTGGETATTGCHVCRSGSVLQLRSNGTTQAFWYFAATCSSSQEVAAGEAGGATRRDVAVSKYAGLRHMRHGDPEDPVRL